MISKEVDKMKFSEYLNKKGYGINKVVELIDVLADTDIDFKAIQDYQKTQSLSKKQLINVLKEMEDGVVDLNTNTMDDIQKSIKEDGLTKTAKHFDISVDELRTYRLHKKGIRAEEEERISIENSPAIDLFRDD